MGDLFGINPGITANPFMYTAEKTLSRPRRRRSARRPPAFEIKAADQQRQGKPEENRRVLGQGVTKPVQARNKRAIT